MKQKLQQLFGRLKKLEAHPATLRLQYAADHVVDVVSHRQYQGPNPAVAAVYAPLRISLIAMLALFFVIFVLGSLVPIDSAAIARGHIVVLSNKKTVQHLEGGIIRAILVKEGDKVKEGQPLMELSDIASKASQTIVRSELYAARVSEARLLALKQGANAMTVDKTIQEAAKANPELAKAIATQKDMFLTQRRTRNDKLKTLKQRIELYNEEITGLRAQVRSADGQLKLITQEVAPMQRLVSKGYAAKPQLLALQRRQQELEGNRGQYLAGIAKARQSITETNMQIVDMGNEFDTQNTTEMKEVQAQLADYEERLRATSDVVARTSITSPYEGIVTGLKYHTVGGVITPGSPIMDIVPQQEKLVVEAQVNPSDIDVVEPGLSTRVSFSAYKTRSLPRLGGKVTHVSADAFTTQEAVPQSYYTARVEVDNEELSRLDEKVKLYPGMPIEVFINTGSRSFLGYLFAPITQSLHRAFRED